MEKYEISVAATKNNYYFSVEPPMPLDMLEQKGNLLNPDGSQTPPEGWLLGCLMLIRDDEIVLGFNTREIGSDDKAIEYAHKLAAVIGGILVSPLIGEDIADWQTPCPPRKSKAKTASKSQ